jgi:hypothetical protein
VTSSWLRIYITIRELYHIIPEVSKTTIHEAVTKKIGVPKIVRKLGAQNVNGRSQNETDGFRADVSHATHRKEMS